MKKLSIIVSLLATFFLGWWAKGYIDSDSCYDAGGIWEKRGGYCYGARSAD